MKATHKAYLTQQFSGADNDPSQMGTTGLIAWVLAGTTNNGRTANRWQRFNAAVRVIKSRKLNVNLFVNAILSTGKRYGINLNRLYSAVQRNPNRYHVTPCAQFTSGSELAEMNEMDAKHPGWETMECAN